MKKIVIRLLFFVFVVAFNSAHAAPGELDTSLGGTGFVRTGFGFGIDTAKASVLQGDGKLIVAGNCGGNFGMVRFNPNDTLDITFGNLGKVVMPVGFSSSQANAVRVQGDGKILLAGYSYHNETNTDAVVIRFNGDGSVDNDFGTNGNGMVVLDGGPSDSANALILPGTGKILVAGSIGNGQGTHSDVFVARYLTNGVLDTTFDGDGIAKYVYAGSADCQAMTLQADGNILLAGTRYPNLMILRFLTNGVLDTTFDGDGVFINTNLNSNYSSHGYAITIQGGGITINNPDKIVVVGYEGASVTNYIATLRLNLDGTLDSTFGTNGKVLTRAGGFFEIAFSVLIQRTGLNASRIIVGGYSYTAGPNFTNRFTIVKYLLSGTLDTAFGSGGIVNTFVPGSLNYGNQISAMMFQSGKILAIGESAQIDGNSDFVMARYNLTDGSLDTTYDGDGFKFQDVADQSSSAHAVAVQSDGKIVVAGNANNSSQQIMSLARYNPDGSLDLSFGDLGKYVADFGTNNSVANAVAIQSDGKIVAGGYVRSISGNNDFAIWRLTTNGLPDATFDGDGVAINSLVAANDVVNSVAIQSDGKIVASGNAYNGPNQDFGVARYNANGSLDTSFNGTGKAITSIGTSDDIASSVKIQADGKIIVAGYTSLASLQFAMVRYNTNGTLDNSFGSFGRVATDFGVAAEAFAMTIQTNGRIVLAGVGIESGTSVDFALARYLTNGTLDTSFGGDGKVTTPIGLTAEFAYGVDLQKDGKILAAGIAQIGADNKFALVRYLPDGSVDTSYGLGGKAVVDLSTNASDMPYGLALDDMGRAILVGLVNDRFAVARVLGDPILKILSVSRLPSGHAIVQGIGVPNGAHTLLGSTNLNTGTFSPIGPVPADASGNWLYDDATAIPLSQRFYRLSIP